MSPERPPHAPPGRFGLTILNAGAGPARFARAGEIALAAQEAGFGTVWTSELYSRSSTILMGSLAAATETVGIGSSIAYGVGRTPLVWVAEARDLDELSAGRLVLGLGNGNTTMMEAWHGVDGAAPAVRMEELVVVLRKLWGLHEGPVDHDGRFYRVHLRPTSDTPPPYRAHLPIHIAGINPRMVQVAGRVADGLIGHPMFTGRYVNEVVRPAIASGAQRTERDPEDVALTGILMCAVDDDVARARRQIAFSVAQYAASRVFDRMWALHGWADAQARIRDAARARDPEAMADAVPADAVDAIGVACRPGELAAAVERHAADYDHLDLTGPAWGLGAAQQERAEFDILDEMRETLAPTP